MKKFLLTLLLSGLGSLALFAAEPVPPLTVHKVFSSHMVLQQKKPIRISGTAAPEAQVKVEIGDSAAVATASPDGEWEAVLPELPAGGPYTVKASIPGSDAEIKLDDVLVGEVWFCGGQSNMQLKVELCRTWPADADAAEAAEADAANVRLFNVAHVPSTSGPVKETPGTAWTRCTAESLPPFSAAGYFFARQIARYLKVPVGVIACCWGGTPIQAWISEKAYRANGCDKEVKRIEDIREIYRTPETLKNAKAKYAAKIGKWYEKLVSKCAVSDSGYAAENADAVGWRTSKDGRFPGRVHGIGFLRRTVELPADWAGKDLICKLGRIADVDVVYFNGEKIGATPITTPQSRTVRRSYPVPGRLVRAGKNVIAVRVDSFQGQGGLTDGGGNLVLQSDRAQTVGLQGDWQYKMAVKFSAKQLKSMPKDPMGTQLRHSPSMLFAGMTAPWGKYNLRGVIWYQGCANSGQPSYYKFHKMLIADWRDHWQDPEMPFILTQLAGYYSHRPKNPRPEGFWRDISPMEHSDYAITREIQAEMLKVPHVGMAVAIDVGNPNDIHPRNKRTVGFRRAKVAERVAYGSKEITQGPLFKSMTVEGNSIRVAFDNAPNGLVTSDGKDPNGFAIAGADGNFVWADAKIDGSTVVVSSPQVPQPRNVRYLFVQYRGDTNLRNTEGFAAGPFRSDKPEFK